MIEKEKRERIRTRNIEPKKKKKRKQHKEILNDEATGENQQWMMITRDSKTKIGKEMEGGWNETRVTHRE